MYYKVKEVSDMVGLSIRMLHHYDKINLLKPHHVTEAGYRQYSEADLDRLQKILFYRELDFSLSQIKIMLEDTSCPLDQILLKHRKLLEMKVERLQKVIYTLDLTLQKYKRGESMSSKEKFCGFDQTEIEKHKEKYMQEVKDLYGQTDAYKEYEKKTANYTIEDYATIQQKTNNTYQKLVQLMDEDITSSNVQELVGELRQQISDHYYNCTLEIFEGLGQMYVTDERFTKNLDQHGKGFAKYLSKAIAYYCRIRK